MVDHKKRKHSFKTINLNKTLKVVIFLAITKKKGCFSQNCKIAKLNYKHTKTLIILNQISPQFAIFF